jgi:hypothetical protein
MQQPIPTKSEMFQQHTVPKDPLAEAIKQFETWRRQKTGRARIPAELWQLACQAARTHGTSKTAVALKLDYYRLKRHVDPDTTVTRPATRKRPKAKRPDVPFVELAPLPEQAAPECELELANAQGVRLVLRWKGTNTPDLARLGQVFWNR